MHIDLTKWIRLHPRYVLPVTILAVILVLLPPAALPKFGVAVLMERYRMWVGLVALTGAALLVSHAAFWAWRSLAARSHQRGLLKAGRSYVKGLTNDEKLVLSKYLVLGTKSARLDYSDGVVRGLEMANVIMRVSAVGDVGMRFAFNIQPWAWSELNGHQKLLEPVLSQEKKRLEDARTRQQVEREYLVHVMRGL